ncbi:helix-turn-helix domain-containing protein [Deinococcus sp. Arct2-2]|uniref:helix-turn-helix domain-containing protein n=1 Tax=Deinococcus sp. Arct2-2 TaxID=2568653 RepID=UPI001F0E8030|nr:helix-turn-helix domain-containing protein [Deinococcus sp. Arct2-2]
MQRSRGQILWLHSKRVSIPEIKAVTDFLRTTISTLIRAYNEGGAAAAVDRRRWNRAAAALNPEQRLV